MDAADGKTTTEVPDDEWPVRVKLNKKIKNKDAEDVDYIEFREPTGGDIAAVGCPVIPDFESGTVTFDAPKMHAMMARLSGVPLPFINKMNSVDWAVCATKLQRFFLPEVARLML